MTSKHKTQNTKTMQWSVRRWWEIHRRLPRAAALQSLHRHQASDHFLTQMPWIHFSVGTFGGRGWKEFHLHLWPLRWQLKQKVSFIRLRLKSCHSVFKDKVKVSFHLRLFRELKTKQTIEKSEVWPYRPMCALCFLPTGSFKHGFGRDHQGCNDCVWFLESKIISDLLLPVT